MITILYRRLALSACTLGVLLAAAPALAAQAPATDIPVAPRFEIVRFAVEGNTLLKPEEVERALAPYTGKQKDFSDIQRALESLEQVYRNRGYGIVQVLLPEQDITRGVVQMRVMEPRIGTVIVEGNQHFDESNIRSSLPELKPGSTPNSKRIGRNLQLLAEHPAKQTTVLLKAGQTENEVDATVKVVDERPLKYVVTLDNSGTSSTGRYRTGFGLQHSNVFNRDHTLNLQYVTNPEEPSAVTIFGVGYRIPFYAYNSSLDLFAGYSNVDSGTLQGLFSVSGSGTIFGTRYNLHLPKIAEYEHKLSFGLDYRAFKNEVLLEELSLVPDITIHPASIGYSGLWRMTNAELGFYATYSQNIPGGKHGRDSDFNEPPPGFVTPVRTDAPARYRIWRAGVNYSRVFAKEWQLRAVLNGQYTNDALVPGEQFGFGGPDSVRGFDIREVSNDRGYSGSLEVYTPELGSKFDWKWKELKTRLLAFYDFGTTGRNSIQPGDPLGQSGGSVGVGLRLAYGKQLSLRVDFAQIVDPAGSQTTSDQKLNASMAVVF